MAHQKKVDEFAAFVDVSVVNPEFTPGEIRDYVQRGVELGCKAVCINSSAIDIAREITASTGTGICVVCDFPFGASEFDWKCLQTNRIAAQPEVDEIDVVLNYGLIRANAWDKVYMEAAVLTDLCHDLGKAIKLILETDALSIPEIAMTTELSARAGADFVKNSTGFFTGGEAKGATAEVIRAMIKAAKGQTKINAFGGIRNQEHFFKLIDLSVDRISIDCLSMPGILGV